MLRFDVNCVLGRWPTGGPTLGSPPALLERMDYLGVGRALVRHTLSIHYDAAEGNDQLMRELVGNSRLEPCWALVPPGTGEIGPDWLAEMTTGGARAAVIYPASHGYPLAAWQCDGLLAPLAERRYLLLLETSEAKWEPIDWLCGAYPALRVVLLSPGYRALRPLYALLDAHPNLYLDVSNLANFKGIETVCRRFGSDRLLLGTGEPRVEGAGPITGLAYADLSEEETRAIAAGNLVRMLEEVQR